MLSLLQSHIIYLEAIVSPDSQPSTSVWHETLRCCILSAPGYQSSRCWCWGGMRMLSSSLSQDKWTQWRWWLRAVINALWGSGVAAQGCPRGCFCGSFLHREPLLVLSFVNVFMPNFPYYSYLIILGQGRNSASCRAGWSTDLHSTECLSSLPSSPTKFHLVCGTPQTPGEEQSSPCVEWEAHRAWSLPFPVGIMGRNRNLQAVIHLTSPRQLGELRASSASHRGDPLAHTVDLLLLSWAPCLLFLIWPWVQCKKQIAPQFWKVMEWDVTQQGWHNLDCL